MYMNLALITGIPQFIKASKHPFTLKAVGAH